MYIKDAVGVTSSNNVFQYCYAADSGAIFWLTSTSITDTNTDYNYNQALSGGVVRCDTCSSSFTDMRIETSLARNGGSFYVSG